MNDNLPIFSIKENLKHFETSKKEAAKGIQRIPDKEFRLVEEDIYESEKTEDG
jgi:hypothetical protein